MKKSILVMALSLFAFLMIGCGCGNDKTPENFQVYNIQLGGLTQEEFETALIEGVESYYINVTLDDDNFPVSGEVITLKYNENLDLTDAVKKINKGDLTAEDIEANLFTLGNEKQVESGLKEAYLAFLQAELSAGQALKQEAESEGKDTVTATVTDDNSNTSSSSDSTVSAGISSVLPDNAADAINNAQDGEEVEIPVLTDEEIAAIQKKIDDMIDPTRASIKFDDEKEEYIGVDGVSGEAKDFSKAASVLLEAANNMLEEATLTTSFEYKEGELVSESADIQEAIDEANSYLTLSIIHKFNSPKGKTGTDTIEGSDIHNFLYVGVDGRTLEIDGDAITQHASSIANEYSDITETKEEDNSSKKVTVTRKGYEPSSQDIYTNIYNCLDKKESGEFDVEFKEVNDSTTSDSGSTYVYVDLDSQTATLYVNGSEVASGSITSGCVSNGCATPNGTYYIYYKTRNTVLRGANYASYVNFWMPFNGGIGLHDASWRSSFGGTDYFFNGSHGCINMPYSLAQTIYNNVSSGTKVIVTGGVKTLKMNDPNLNGQTSYHLNVGDSTGLNISKDTSEDLSYSSSNSDVVTVDSNGYITAVGSGYAEITVSCPYTSDGEYNKGSMVIYVYVNEPQSEPIQPATIEPETTTEATTTEPETTTEATTTESASETNSGELSST